MLVLSRKVGQKLMIGDGITIVVNRIAGNRVSLGIEAPDDVHVMRGELEPVRRGFEEPAQCASQPITFCAELDTASLPRVAR